MARSYRALLAGSVIEWRNPARGDSIALVPGYSPTTVNMYDAFFVVSGERVVDVWPVVPRGPGDQGLASL